MQHELSSQKWKLGAEDLPPCGAPEDKLKENEITKTSSTAGKRRRSVAIIPQKFHCGYQSVEIPPIRAVLFYGPKGCGKKYLVRAIAGELKVPLIKVAANELVYSTSNESVRKI
ncbi:hypothetical protein CEXT_555661 [Caerostris extrusa]|uniref:ATPase AAA-type core domain-containing protein n=1 Tax=Caerostris extrusa TaxID=172846 RepID=A0AAV4MHZ1_CAEEX|nr:hypothetical protein CEXT_555661 [Caerostris extrusa]